MDRSLIMLIGASGSGKTTLGKNMAEQLRPEMSVEHISMGDVIRHIGGGAVESAHRQIILDHLNSRDSAKRLDDETIYGVMSEALVRADSSDVVLLDGAPRTPAQVGDVSELALKDDRRISGAIMTFLENNEASVARLLKRRPREFSEKFSYGAAVEQFNYTNMALSNVVSKLDQSGISIRYVETSGEKHETTRKGVAIARFILTPTPNEKL